MIKRIVMILLDILYLMMAIWVCLALWVHLPLGGMTYLLIFFIGIMVILFIWQINFIHQSLLCIKPTNSYLLFWLIATAVFVWFIMMTPSNDRQWQDEFRHQFTYTKKDNIITINHVRNFHWYDDTYHERWQTRQYDINKLKYLDMISTTWGNDNIAHIMLSFGFENKYGNIDRLVLSVEARKETHEEFSTIGGFFRLYDLSIIAGDERDLIYTRTNIRKEQVSIYPIEYHQEKIKQLFLTYLDYGQNLSHTPKFYHSLLSNCTTVIYDMIKGFDTVPVDYRIIVSGRLSSYLYEHGAIDNAYPLNVWQTHAHANPKVAHLGKNSSISSSEFSRLIRQGLPKSHKPNVGVTF